MVIYVVNTILVLMIGWCYIQMGTYVHILGGWIYYGFGGHAIEDPAASTIVF